MARKLRVSTPILSCRENGRCSADPAQTPRVGRSPNTRPNRILWTGLGCRNFGSTSRRTPLHASVGRFAQPGSDPGAQGLRRRPCLERSEPARSQRPRQAQDERPTRKSACTNLTSCSVNSLAMLWHNNFDDRGVYQFASSQDLSIRTVKVRPGPSECRHKGSASCSQGPQPRSRRCAPQRAIQRRTPQRLSTVSQAHRGATTSSITMISRIATRGAR